MNRFSNWLLSAPGKKFSYFAAGTITTGVLFGHVLPHTILLDKYQEFLMLYKNGFAVSLPSKLRNRFEKTLDLLEVNEKDRQLFKPFATSGFDIRSAGSSYSKFGVIVGLPANFFYDDVSSVDKNSIKLGGEPVIWELQEGQLLLNSLVMSENAQMYAMAREIKYRETPKLFLDTIVSVMSCTGVYGFCHTINDKWDLYMKPRPIRLIFYSLVGAFAFGSWALCKDASQVYFEEKIDKELREKHIVFTEGGKEYYSKLLERNIALRKLLGKEGEKAFSSLGNENYFIRCKHVPLTQRKEFFYKNVEEVL